jgi:hypothetical protein
MILSTHGVIASQIASASLLLDLYPSAAAAYSVRKLRTSYTGSAIRVRRSSDNSEQNIGFDGSGNLDTSTLTSFCGSGNGFVTTWYDQSGTGNNATQTTASAQPQIVSSGSVITTNGKPSLLNDGVDDFLNLTTITPASNHSIFGVGKRNSVISALMSYLGNSSTGARNGLLYFTDNFLYLLAQSNFRKANTLDISTAQQLNSGFVISGASDSIYKNNTLVASTSTSSTPAQGFDFIGQYGGLYSSANFQEVILYQSNQTSNRTGISTNINSYYGIY